MVLTSEEGAGEVAFFFLLLILAFIAIILTSGARPINATSPATSGQATTSGATGTTGTNSTRQSGGSTTAAAAATNLTAAGCASDIAIGKQLDVLQPNVRMRQSPGYINKNDDTDTIVILQPGNVLLTLDGPVIKDGLCWWKVQYADLQGWVADHSPTGVQLLADP
jgi:hypothetical protein